VFPTPLPQAEEYRKHFGPGVLYHRGVNSITWYNKYLEALSRLEKDHYVDKTQLTWTFESLLSTSCYFFLDIPFNGH
jgi:hypothetical protein